MKFSYFKFSLISSLWLTAGICEQLLSTTEGETTPEEAGVKFEVIYDDPIYENDNTLVVDDYSETQLRVNIHNLEYGLVTLQSIQFFYEDLNGRRLENLTELNFNENEVPRNTFTYVDYSFYSGLPLDYYNLKGVIKIVRNETLYQVPIIKQHVLLIEPSTSIFDIQALFALTLLLSAIGSIGYWIYGSYIAPTYKPKRKDNRPKEVPAAIPEEILVEEWIPATHLAETKQRKKQA